MTLSWLSVDARTGDVLADLPGLDVPKVSRSICRYDSATASLPLPTAPDGWELATRPGGSVMVLLSDDLPIWGGMVTIRPKGSGDNLQLTLATEESYLDGRFVGDVTYTGVGQNAIVADLCARYVSTGPRGGIPLRVVQVGGAGTLRDRTYTDASDKSIYSVLTELSGVIDGPEWTIEWERTIVAGKPIYTPVMYVGARIGTPVMAGMAPAAVFDLPGCVTEALVIEDYSAGKGANVVSASTTGDGTTRLVSAPQVAPDDGRPTREYRFAASTSITDQATLDTHAANALATIKDGSTAISLSAILSAAPALGSVWVLGDDVGYDIGGVEADPAMAPIFGTFTDTFSDTFGSGMGETLAHPGGRSSVPAFPDGLSGVARAWGWSLDLGPTPIISPILATEV